MRIRSFLSQYYDIEPNLYKAFPQFAQSHLDSLTSLFFFLLFHDRRRVRSGSGVSALSSASVDQRLPEEPVLEDEQQLEKKLPGNLHSSSITSEVSISEAEIEAEISLMTSSCAPLAALRKDAH